MERQSVIVAGAGAAGLMAAIASASAAAPTAILDGRKKIGAKILISGGTRCNVTHKRVVPEDYFGGARHFVKHVLEAYPPARTIEFFESIGVPLVLEDTGKLFPTTHSGKTVLEALLRETERAGALLVTEAKVVDVRGSLGRFEVVLESGTSIAAERVILATGGLSYPETGSDGTGLRIAERLGHKIVRTVPALTPLTTSEARWTELSGVAVNAALSFYEGGKKVAAAAGPLLFTHFGFSGPSALDISRHIAGAEPASKPSIRANFIPDADAGDLKRRLETARDRHPRTRISSFLADEFGFPVRFAEIFLSLHTFEPAAWMSRLSGRAAGILAHDLTECDLSVNGVLGYKKAEVTAGGVDLSEVRAATLESRRVPGLYFAGEILDVDGRIGGFNFQWAWSSGHVAGSSAAKSLA